MAGGDGGSGPGAGHGWRWDVALSFAGAQRAYVEQVAAALKARGVRCFYDEDEQVRLWGRYLAEELPRIYAEESAAVVVFVSAEYADRDWARLERRAALDRAVRERREYVLPARFDDTPLPGLLAGMVAVDLRSYASGQFADLVAAKLASLAAASPSGPQVPDSPPPAGQPPSAPALPSRLARTLTGHTSLVDGVAFSPDGLLLATASLDGTARLWDVATGGCLRTLTYSHRSSISRSPYSINEVFGVAFSPDGRLLATTSYEEMALWDPATGHCLRTLTGHTSVVYGVAFSPDGRLLATVGYDQTARVWDPVTGHCLRTLTGHTSVVYGVAFSPDGRLLATASYDQTARVWDPATGHCQRILTGHTNRVLGVAFSPDGRLLATASEDGTARVWDPATGHCQRILTGHTGTVLGVAFSPDGRLLATAGYDQTARVWDPATGHCQRTLTGHTRVVYGVAFSPDGRLLATAGEDGTARMWD